MNGLAGMIELAEKKQLRAAWIAFHPQLVGDDAPEIIAGLNRLIGALEFSVVSTTHDFEWARKASVLLPMAAWTEELGTYTNYDGRVQITNRSVMPPGEAQPLHVFMAELLELAGVRTSAEPRTIFEWAAGEVPLYAGMDYDSIGALGMMPAQTPQEVTR
jgi:predicted molibdopterin-dependent oxidoreductase YjgC